MGHTHQAPFAQTNDALINEVLGEYGDLTRQRLQAFLPQEEPKSYLYELLADYPLRGGKMLRSSLCIAMARATGAPVEDAIASAVAIELMHNALLVHDDIEDDSIERRGSPTLHALHGVPLALNAGDAMGLLSMRPLKENFHRLGIATALRIFEETERMAWQSAEGQAQELGWQRDNRTDVTEEDYLDDGAPEDVLACGDPSAAGRMSYWSARAPAARSVDLSGLLLRRRLPDPGRYPQSRAGSGVWQGNQW